MSQSARRRQSVLPDQGPSSAIGDEAGHNLMWFAARDIAFENPVTVDETETMLTRMGIRAPGGEQPSPEEMRKAAEALRIFSDLSGERSRP